MSDIKPFKYWDLDTQHSVSVTSYSVYQSRVPEYAATLMPLYDEAALAAAREEGRRQGLEEATTISDDEIYARCLKTGAVDNMLEWDACVFDEVQLKQIVVGLVRAGMLEQKP